MIELSDGRLLVLHLGDNRLLLLDPREDTARPVSRSGSGPGEYLSPNALFAFPGDTSAVRDATGMGKLLLIHPDGQSGKTLPASPGRNCQPILANLLHMVRAADGTGRLYSQAEPYDMHARGQIRFVDSAAIVRWRGPCAADTVAFVPTPASERAARGRPGPRPFSASAIWAVGRDGRVGILHPDPFRIDLVLASGERRTGAPIQYERQRVTEEIKQRYREAFTRPRRVEASSRDGRAGVLVVRPPWTEPDTWPKYVPPYHAQFAALFAPDGRLWIRPLQTDEDAPLSYFVVDDFGRLVERVTLPARTYLVAFGRNSLYLVRRDADDIERIERHTIPQR